MENIRNIEDVENLTVDNVDELLNDNVDKYDENRFWKKIQSIGMKIGITPIYLIFLIYYSVKSKDISMSNKIPLAGALGYFINAIDLIPDLTPVLGYCDDFSIVVGALGLIASQITEEIRVNAKNSTRKIFPNIQDEEFSIIDKMYETGGKTITIMESLKRMKKDTRKKRK